MERSGLTLLKLHFVALKSASIGNSELELATFWISLLLLFLTFYFSCRFTCFACVVQCHLLKVIQIDKLKWHSLKIKAGDQDKAPKSWEGTV
ncbi:hypothetical protein H5410_019736 [Solanum commersonii]|uniref:Uncharacterized protein n=1 Tax=Solanum commersonii TaxID=4109 RepID=A0A9J5Z967_SOLCO|nr:hypothetical protein H5410_019736 [Solanum commersonii]